MLKKKSYYNILGREVKVFYEQQMPDHLQNNLGYFDPNTFTIHLVKHAIKKEELRTLYHEIFHAILERVGVTRTATSHDAHEVIVEAFANFMMDQKDLPKKRSKKSKTTLKKKNKTRA